MKQNINSCLKYIYFVTSAGKRVNASQYINYNARRCTSGKWVGREPKSMHHSAHAIVEEVEQEVKLALWVEYASETIDCEDAEVKLLVKRCIDRTIQREYREQSPAVDSTNEDAYAHHEANLGRQYGSYDAIFEDFENAILVDDMLSYMPIKTRKAFVARMDLGCTWEQTANAAGVKDRKTAMSLVRQGVEIAKHYLDREDEEEV